MKRLLTVFAACLLLFAAACTNPASEVEQYTQTDINVDQLKDKINNADSFLLLVERDNCPFCEAMNEYVQSTKNDHNLEVFRLDITDMDLKKAQPEDKVLVSETEDGKKFLELQPWFFYTPTIYKYRNGKADQAAIGWNDVTEEVSVWDTNSTIDFDKAETMPLWEFMEK